MFRRLILIVNISDVDQANLFTIKCLNSVMIVLCGAEISKVKNLPRTSGNFVIIKGAKELRGKKNYI